MPEKEDYKELFKDKLFAIDDQKFHLEEVIVHDNGEDDKETSYAIHFKAVDDPGQIVKITVPRSALFLFLRTFFSLKDASGDFMDDVETLATEAAKVTKKYKDKMVRGLDAFIEEFKKSDR